MHNGKLSPQPYHLYHLVCVDNYFYKLTAKLGKKKADIIMKWLQRLSYPGTVNLKFAV